MARTPVQRRSRERVEAILATAAKLLASGGIDALTMRSLSASTGMPVATIYRYFDSRDEIITAYLEHEQLAIEQSVSTALLATERVTFRSMLEAFVMGHLRHHRANPDGVPVWFEGRLNAAVVEQVRELDGQLAASLSEAVARTGMLEQAALVHRRAARRSLRPHVRVHVSIALFIQRAGTNHLRARGHGGHPHGALRDECRHAGRAGGGVRSRVRGESRPLRGRAARRHEEIRVEHRCRRAAPASRAGHKHNRTLCSCLCRLAPLGEAVGLTSRLTAGACRANVGRPHGREGGGT